MAFVAEAETTIDAPAPRVFDRLADLASWSSWMPRSFAVVMPARAASPSPLRTGDRVRVKIGGAPLASTLTISKVDRPSELAWRGGVRGLLWAEHRFVFEPVGDKKTRVRSIETWRGALSGLLRRFVEPAAVRIGAQQLEGLAKATAMVREIN